MGCRAPANKEGAEEETSAEKIMDDEIKEKIKKKKGPPTTWRHMVDYTLLDLALLG